MTGVAVIGLPSLSRMGIAVLLGKDFGCIGIFYSIKELKDKAKISSDMLILCLSITEETLIAVNEIGAFDQKARVVFLVPTLDLSVMRQCFGAGAYGYLLERISYEALKESLRLVKTGEKVFPSELATTLPFLTSQLPNQTAKTLAPLEFDLSRREIEILQCLTHGHSNKLIANQLQIAEATVKVHIKRILKKARAANRTQAALWGIATGLAAGPLKVNVS